ncbi:MAG: HDOD domain-containing protein [Candidatus Polarisedimenticolaceae bacterium]|nr:HDOD domain-containing protein [Candidatus Polarisedimenticolaceae bacterium]
MNDVERKNRKNKVLDIKHLPPLSATTTQLLEMVSDPGVEIDLLAKIIANDPGLSARILGLANAAFFAQVNPVNTVKEAIVRVLGLNMVKSLAMSIAMCGAFDVTKCKEFDLAQYWITALGCATLSRQIAAKIPAAERPDIDGVYLCGLMRNLGALILAYRFPVEYGGVFQALEQDPMADKRILEEQMVGLTMPQAGEWLADRWHMPLSVVCVIGQYGNRDYTGDYEREVLIVGAVSDWLIRFQCGEACALRDDERLLQRVELEPVVLDEIEEAFREMWDEIRSLANGLV